MCARKLISIAKYSSSGSSASIGMRGIERRISLADQFDEGLGRRDAVFYVGSGPGVSARTG